jgi:glycosyltransferase involved in cell wall biosynthesis
MRIAILGTRGIPASYGGFETFAEELSRRLVVLGHDVTVYCRARHDQTTYLGVRLRYLPTIRHKYLDTVFHTFLSSFHLLARRPDVALFCNAANALFTIAPRLAGIPCALNVDGLERKRRKWGWAGRAWYRASEWMATWAPTEVVSDAREIAAYYRQRYHRHTHFIPYGAEIGQVPTREALDRLGLHPERYFLYVSRLEPENNALEVREAFERVGTDLRLALVGDAPYSAAYIRRLRDSTDARIVMPGAIYGQGYRELQSHCFAYIHATEVGGTHPALIEAMGRGALVLYLSTPENEEVAGGAGVAFTHGTLARTLELVLAMPETEREDLRRRAVQRVRERYSWDAVAGAYEKLFLGMRPRRASAPGEGNSRPPDLPKPTDPGCERPGRSLR